MRPLCRAGVRAAGTADGAVVTTLALGRSGRGDCCVRAGETAGLYSGRAGGVKNFFGVGALAAALAPVAAREGARCRALDFFVSPNVSSDVIGYDRERKPSAPEL